MFIYLAKYEHVRDAKHHEKYKTLILFMRNPLLAMFSLKLILHKHQVSWPIFILLSKT